MHTFYWAHVQRPAKISFLVPTEEEAVIKAQIAKRMAQSPGWFTKTRDAIKGVSEETTTGVHRLYELVKKGQEPDPCNQCE